MLNRSRVAAQIALRDRRRLGLLGLTLLLAVAAYGAVALLPWVQLARGGEALARGDPYQAVAHLEQAALRLPREPFVWRRLAQAELLRGNPAAAVAALERAYALAPEDLLVVQELALAYEANGDFVVGNTLWRALKLDAAALARYGERAFQAGAYADAARWFERALRADGALNESQQFQHEIAMAITAPAAGSAATAFARADGRVPGARLRWVTAHPHWNVAVGDAVTQEAGSEAGVLFWDGAAIAVFEADERGRYLLRVRARHSAPAPVQLALYLNGRRVRDVSLERGDGTAETLEVALDLQAGPQVIAIRFLNDGAINGADRNAIIEWLELAPEAL
ncbi:MAG TPA: carbohydrate-binding domain-containing protein [Chloroflexaceae bacterium]|nr:carbohydrate-binding domain-containing protein [Chloroflexaceae bacterium]